MSIPTPNGNEHEYLTPEQVEQLCPSSKGGVVTRFECKDEKGEPKHNKTNVLSPDHNYRYWCNLEDGAKCELINTNETCPDYAIRIHCTCDPGT